MEEVEEALFGWFEEEGSDVNDEMNVASDHCSRIEKRIIKIEKL